jgi:hypothetical protein
MFFAVKGFAWHWQGDVTVQQFSLPPRPDQAHADHTDIMIRQICRVDVQRNLRHERIVSLP